jgi:alpha-acetolactate decarboxylase
MYDTQIKNLEIAIKQIEQLLLSNPENSNELITRKLKYQEAQSNLRRLAWEEQTQRIGYGDDR